MNKDEFVQFWMVFYDKFFKIDTNQVRIRPSITLTDFPVANCHCVAYYVIAIL